MKKLLTFVCMLACIFGLTACGSEEVISQRDQESLAEAKQKAQYVVYVLADIVNDDESLDFLTDRSTEEIEYVVENVFGLETDGYGFATAIDSFHSVFESVGNIYNNDGSINFGEIKTHINGGQIIVEVEVKGTNKNAVAEVIFSNDLFMVLESAAMNLDSSKGELMVGAALNTLIGMGTVFTVLILISCIISCFKVIPAIQKKMSENKAAKSETNQSPGVDNAVTQIEAQEETSGSDLELAAVIAAAIAAYEGSASTDGFVVRSIRRLRQ